MRPGWFKATGGGLARKVAERQAVWTREVISNSPPAPYACSLGGYIALPTWPHALSSW
jgi:hypothetical protein